MVAQGCAICARSARERARVEIAVARARHERDRAGARDEVADLGLARARSDPDRDEPRLLGGDERHVHAGPVGQEHRDALARREPGAHECGGERIGALRVVAPGERGVAGGERERVGNARGVGVDRLGERLQGGLRRIGLE